MWLFVNKLPNNIIKKYLMPITYHLSFSRRQAFRNVSCICIAVAYVTNNKQLMRSITRDAQREKMKLSLIAFE